MSELRGAKARAAMGNFRIRRCEREAMRMQGDIASLQLTRNEALAPLSEMQDERQELKDSITKQLRVYKQKGLELAQDRWHTEEMKRRRQMNEMSEYVKGAEASAAAIQRGTVPEAMQGEAWRFQEKMLMDAKLANEVVDILSGGDPQDLLHSQCYEGFLDFIRNMPVNQEPIRPLFMDGRGVLTSIVSNCRAVGWDEVRTAKYITRHWSDLRPVYLSEP